MAKTIWKFEVPLGDEGLVVETTGPILPFAAMSQHGLNVWIEVSAWDDEPVVVHLHVVLTGQIIPEKWEWIASARTPDGEFVGHLYKS